MSSTPAPFAEGVPYGKYRLLEPLGVGSRGRVHRALEPAIDRLVALRVLHKPAFASEADARAFSERARTDAQAAARLMHAGIAAVYEYDDQGGDIVIASEYVQGWPLVEVLNGHVRLTPTDVLCIARQTLEALAFAHEAGVPHGHLGPGGVLLGRSGHVKITGFGSPRLAIGDAATTGAPSAGTLARRPYTAPECLGGEAASAAADLFACGVMLRELMERAAAQPAADALVETDPLRAGLPQRLAPLWQQASAMRPQDRPASARAMLLALAAAAQMPFPGAVRVSAMPPLTGAGRPVAHASASLGLGATGPQPLPSAGSSGLEGMPPTGPGRPTGSPPTAPRPPANADADMTVSGPMAPVAASRPGAQPGTHPGARPAPLGAFFTGPQSAATGPGPVQGQVPSGPGAGTGPQPVGSLLDPTALQGLQDLLTRQIGPVARVLVQRHAPGAPSLRDLAARLADEALPAEDHAAFFAKVARLPSGGHTAGSPTPVATTGTGPTGPSVPREDIPAEWLARVQQALVAHMGPVATVLLRQARPQALGREDLIRRVLAMVDDEGERDALARVLGRLG